MRYLRFRGCTVRVWRDDYLETVFPDGKITPAMFTLDAENRYVARYCGYGDDVMAMHREHDIAHTFLAEATGQVWSPVLRHVAGGRNIAPEVRAAEEGRVLAFQRYCRTGQYDSVLDVYPDIDTLVVRFKDCIELLWGKR